MAGHQVSIASRDEGGALTTRGECDYCDCCGDCLTCEDFCYCETGSCRCGRPPSARYLATHGDSDSDVAIDDT
jgi:hypothetical protein